MYTENNNTTTLMSFTLSGSICIFVYLFGWKAYEIGDTDFSAGSGISGRDFYIQF